MKYQNLKKLRISLGITVGKAAEEMFVTPQTICNIESGRTVKESSLFYYELYLKYKKKYIEHYRKMNQ